MADINAQIDSLTTILKSAQAKQASDQKLFDDNTALVNDYLRQINYHQANNDSADADIVSVRLNNTYIERTALGNNLIASKALYTKASEDLKNVVDNLTPTQQSILTSDVQTKLANATSNALQIKSAVDKQNFAQKNVQYIIIGAIVLVIVIVTVIIIRKRKKSKLV